jgi:serine/threonine-protein kinase RIM15
MAGNVTPNPQFLAPPAVTALRQEARALDPTFSPLNRSLSDNMQEEREDLKEAAEQTLNVIVDLDLDGRIKWVSPSWKQVVGTVPESVEGRNMTELLVGNKDAFRDATESMKEDDSRSRFIRFALEMGPDSVLKYSPEPRPQEFQKVESIEGQDEKAVRREDEPPQELPEHNHDVLNMEGQGIMAYDRTAEGAGHVGVLLFPILRTAC